MAIIQSQNPAAELNRIANGSYLDDAATPANASILVGFTPRYVSVVNETDRITFEWYQGMPSGGAVQTVAAGTRTLVGTGGVTVGADRTIGFPVLQNKQYRYVVLG